MSNGGATMANGELWAVDTSVAVAALDAGHGAHGPCLQAVREHRPALAGHAAFETFSVLTRLPGGIALDPGEAHSLLQRVFPETIWLESDETSRLYERLAVLGITGGAVYDALIGQAAESNRCRLLTRDARARRTYDLLGVDRVFVGP